MKVLKKKKTTRQNSYSKMYKCETCNSSCDKMLTANGKPVCDGKCCHVVLYGTEIKWTTKLELNADSPPHPVFSDDFVFESVNFN